MRGILAAVLVAALAGPARAQSAADSAAIVATARDYIEGWYSADAPRMARALHPELVKRIQSHDTATGRWWIENQGAGRLVQGTARGGGSRTPPAARRADVRILDVFRRAAVVRVDATDWVDFLQLVREGERWLILNVVWELRGP
jgi:hypothetical protein